MKREIEKTALHNSQRTVYASNEAEAENMIGGIVEPMSYGETKRIVLGDRVYCIYKMDSGKIEMFSYGQKQKHERKNPQ